MALETSILYQFKELFSTIIIPQNHFIASFTESIETKKWGDTSYLSHSSLIVVFSLVVFLLGVWGLVGQGFFCLLKIIRDCV